MSSSNLPYLVALLPAVLPMVATTLVIASFLITSTFIRQRSLERDTRGAHVLITGASQGLGKALALRLAKLGPPRALTIVARGKQGLEDVQDLLKDSPADVNVVAVDLADSIQTVEGLRTAWKNSGPFDLIFAVAGGAIPGFVADQSDDGLEFERMVDQNYISAVNVTRAVINLAKETRTATDDAAKKNQASPYDVVGLNAVQQSNMPRRIVLVGSVLSTIAFVGYASYAASKYALRGFADALRSELTPLHTKVHIYLPANMDTPGFATENTTKPEVTAKIEGAASTITADKAAQKLLAGVSWGRYAVCSDIIGELIRVTSNGVTPRPNTIVEATALPLLTVIFALWTIIADADVRTFFKKPPKASRSDFLRA